MHVHLLLAYARSNEHDNPCAIAISPRMVTRKTDIGD